jgi:ATP-dependent helicase/nuclease subunit A
MTKQIVDQTARDKIKTNLHTNFLVEAGAGSGKTTSLVERMVNLIKTGTSQIHEIVAITFTRKAADELKVRFQSELERVWKEERDEAIKVRLSEALQNIERCFLGTVHAFSAKLLRERPIEANLDLSFKELEESDDLEILEEAWHNYLQNLQEEQPHLLKEMDDLGITVEELFQCLRDLKDYPDVEWITENTPEPDFLSPFQSFMAIVKEAKRAIPEKEPDKGYDALQKTILLAIQKERFINPTKSRDLISILALFDKKLKPTLNRWSSKEDAKYYEEKLTSSFETSIKPLIQAWREHCHPKIIRFLQGAMEEYSRLKNERSLLNFQDLLILSADLLKNNREVRQYFQSKYRFLLVDEFQDTDPIQAELMFFLTSEDLDEKNWTSCKPRPGSLFVVGDPKQAIYRFRRADIDTYNRVKELIEWHGGEVLQLTMNFRTVDTVTNVLNTVFVNHLPEHETVYQAAYRPLNSYHIDKGRGFTGIKRLIVPQDFTKKEDIIQKDAENIAQVIKQLVEQGHKPMDFLVLTRYNDGISVYAETIENVGIPASISGEIIIGEMREFQELSILLNTFVDPTDEVSFIAAIRGIFFGINDNELYQWKKGNGRFSLYSEIPEGFLEEKAKEKFALTLEKLKTYQKWIRQFSPTVAIERIMEDVGFYPLLLKNQRNKRAFKSLLQIMEVLRNHESEGNHTFKEIYRLFSEMVFEKTVVINIEEDADAVRIMNVHKAKGLEAQVVFLAHPAKLVKPESFLTKHIKREDDFSKGYFAFTIRNGFQEKELGFPRQWNSYKEEELRYLVDEEMRILYVAATRAEKALVISSSAKNDSKNPWATLFEAEMIENVELPLDLNIQAMKPSLTITLADYQRNTKNKQEWLEERKTNSYDTWSPTKDKDFSQLAGVERDEGGGMNWGTLIHAVLEKVVKGYDVHHYIRQALQKYDIPIEREDEVNLIIDSFRQTKIWEEVFSASEVLTEVPFSVSINKEDNLYMQMDRQVESSEPVFVKGVIDLVYKLEDNWVIVDYKTDRPTNEEDFQRLQEFYQGQISFYKNAWGKLTNEKVSRAELFFVYQK